MSTAPFAVIQTGGKQYLVRTGDTVAMERIPDAKGTIRFTEVLLHHDGKALTVGTPTVPKAVVEATVVQESRGPKLLAVRFRPKKRVHKVRGHRQQVLTVTITKV